MKMTLKWDMKNNFSPQNRGYNIIKQYMVILLYCLHITSFLYIGYSHWFATPFTYIHIICSPLYALPPSPVLGRLQVCTEDNHIMALQR